MEKIIVDSAALIAVARSIEHELLMMGFSDDDAETALDTWEFSGPRIRRAVNDLRSIVNNAPKANKEQR